MKAGNTHENESVLSEWSLHFRDLCVLDDVLNELLRSTRGCSLVLVTLVDWVPMHDSPSLKVFT